MTARMTKAYSLLIRLPDGRSRRCGCGTRDRSRYDAMRAWVQALKYGATRRLDILEAIVARGVPLADAFDARANPDAILGMTGARNIEPYVTAWFLAKRGSRKGGASAPKYLRQVREFIPEGRVFQAARFSASEIRRFLRALDVSEPTRNRYKAALSSFGEYLVEENVLERNPVRDVTGFPEGRGRDEFYELDEAERLLEAMGGVEEAGAVALAMAACVEWQALQRVRVRDLDWTQRTAFLNAHKTNWRRREAHLLPIFGFCDRYIKAAAADKLPDALLFPSLRSDKQVLRAIKDAAEAINLRRLTLHDQRHTHIVNGLRAGYSPQAMAHNAGHANAHLVWTRYGRYVANKRDFVPAERAHDWQDVKENRA